MKINKNIIKTLKNGGVGVLPTDTLYGLVGSALSKKAVERIYRLKKRSPQKPFIILIAGISDLQLFGVKLGSDTCQTLRETIKGFWPGPVSIVLDCPNLSNLLSYLRPLNNTLAFRCPWDKWLHNLLKQTGPLVAPSANCEGEIPAENIEQAKRYFGEQVDFYFDGGILVGKPSTLIALKDGRIEVLRKGALKV